MADSFLINLTARDTATLTMSGYNNGPTDPLIYMEMMPTSDFTLLPNETLRVLITPTGVDMTAAEASGNLLDPDFNNIPASGIYVYEKKNTSVTDRIFKAWERIYLFGGFSNLFENTEYALHWIQTLDSQENRYGNHSGEYSLPHNIQASEVTLTMEPYAGNMVRYNFAMPGVINSGNALYTGTHRPYLIGFHFDRGRFDQSISTASGDIDGVPYGFNIYGDVSGFAHPINTGFVVDLPLYETDRGEVPAAYHIFLGYSGVTGLTNTLLDIFSPHWDFLDNKLPGLDAAVSTDIDQDRLQPVGEIKIDKNDNIIQRERLSVGIKDITVTQNSYKKKGSYISPRYVHDDGVYTFSLRIKEVIPDYPGVDDPYPIIKYYAEFNGMPWVRISPNNRGKEYDEQGVEVPKLLVFDKDPKEAVEGIAYLEYAASITSFRIKIELDISGIEGFVAPPQVWDYKCIIFDKKQLLEL